MKKKIQNDVQDHLRNILEISSAVRGGRTRRVTPVWGCYKNTIQL